MNKKKLLWAAVTVLFLVICVGFLAVSSLDEIVSTEAKELEMGYSSCIYRLTHTFKNGKTVKVNVNAHIDDIMLDNNVHMLKIRIEKDKSSVDGVPASNASYNLSNLSFAAHIEDKNGGRVICAHSCANVLAGAGVEYDPQSISKLTADGSTDGDFIYATYIIQGDFELVDLDVSYDLNGKGMRLGSRFEGQKTNIKIGKKAPPYGGEFVEE